MKKSLSSKRIPFIQGGGSPLYVPVPRPRPRPRILRGLMYGARLPAWETNLSRILCLVRVCSVRGTSCCPVPCLLGTRHQVHGRYRDRTLEIVKRQFYWPGMKDEIARYIRNCHTCQRSKASRDQYNGLLQPLPIPGERWQDISMDFITGLPISNGFNGISTLVDRLTKERTTLCAVQRNQ